MPFTHAETVSEKLLSIHCTECIFSPQINSSLHLITSFRFHRSVQVKMSCWNYPNNLHFHFEPHFENPLTSLHPSLILPWHLATVPRIPRRHFWHACHFAPNNHLQVAWNQTNLFQDESRLHSFLTHGYCKAEHLQILPLRHIRVPLSKYHSRHFEYSRIFVPVFHYTLRLSFSLLPSFVFAVS